MTTYVHLEPTGKYSKKRQWWRAKLEDGTILIEKAWSPGLDACRALLARGVTGEMTTVVGGTKSMTIDIEKGAKLTISENEDHGPMIVPYRPFNTFGEDDDDDADYQA